MLGMDPAVIALRIPVLLIVITVHEFAHARMAYHFGDTTASRQGRMNLNPINHLDPIGSLMILLVGFGWAKPVPINPINFNQYRSGLRWVSFAGPMANLIMGFFSLLLFRMLLETGFIETSGTGLPFMFFQQLIMINIYLALFNLIPIPPLDGSKILMSLLSDANLGIYYQIERYAPLILIGLIITGILGAIIFPIANLILEIYNMIINFIPGI
ncbi:MAG: site-2 protease family protein [Bacillota bacterium]